MLRTSLSLLFLLSLTTIATALDGGPRQMTPRNGWKGFEVISVGNNPPNDGENYGVPSTFDGLGAWLTNPSTLQVLINHETGDGSITSVDIDIARLHTAIANVSPTGDVGGVSFVQGARQAYDRWSNDGGLTWVDTANTTNTSFYRFCSGQSYVPDAFGPGRGFVDNIYMTGEEGSTNRLFALDMTNRDFYQVSGVTGSAPDGRGGMPFDSYENVALLDTGETNHVALLLSPDGGSSTMRLYIGEKGKNVSGATSNDFLARNGLAYGSTYYLNDALPATGSSLDGFFDTTAAGSLTSSKLEDVDTNPADPTQVLLGDEDSGVFIFDFDLDFSSGPFNATNSRFSISKIHNHNNDKDGAIGDADNVDWTAPTILGGVPYPNGLILINEDSGTSNGETWMSRPDGTDLVLIADNIGISTADESTGILDVSGLLGYVPGSILLTSNQGSASSLTVLVHPQAAAVPEPTSLGGTCLIIALFSARYRRA